MISFVSLRVSFSIAFLAFLQHLQFRILRPAHPALEAPTNSARVAPAMWTAVALHLAAAVLLPRTPTPVAPPPAIRAAAFMTAPPSSPPSSGRGDDDLSLDQIVAQVQSNMNEGELSTRGEGWFVGQACLVLGVLFAPAEPVAPVAELTVGLAAIASGLALGAAAVRDLGLANLTPWPKPLEGNQLQIEGVYALCRHPMCTHAPLPMCTHAPLPMCTHAPLPMCTHAPLPMPKSEPLALALALALALIALALSQAPALRSPGTLACSRPASALVWSRSPSRGCCSPWRSSRCSRSRRAARRASSAISTASGTGRTPPTCRSFSRPFLRSRVSSWAVTRP